MVTRASQVSARRPRAFVRVAGSDAEGYLQRMVSNDVAAVSLGGSCEALLLTPKARVIAPLRILRRGPQDFLLLTEPELGERVREELVRMRFAAKCEIEPEEHTSTLVWTDDLAHAEELIDDGAQPTVDPDELERLRIEAGIPAWGKELDESILPAEAGLDETHISFTKGCYPGQEPIARLHYRGHVNRSLRVLEVDLAVPGDEIRLGEKAVGRVTSAVPGLALGYIRTEVPADAELEIAGRPARLH